MGMFIRELYGQALHQVSINQASEISRVETNKRNAKHGTCGVFDSALYGAAHSRWLHCTQLIRRRPYSQTHLYLKKSGRPKAGGFSYDQRVSIPLIVPSLPNKNQVWSPRHGGPSPNHTPAPFKPSLPVGTVKTRRQPRAIPSIRWV